MSHRTYRIPFILALVLCLGLAGALAYQYLHERTEAAAPKQQSDPVVAQGPPAGQQPVANQTAATSEPALVPVQIAPERLQQIGVTTAVAQLKDVRDVLQVPGNVDVDEQRLAYVQTRFPGWIQNVFANATWQYVRKGQRLFTIYSPDLVSTEQEYLLAKQNQKAFAHDMHAEGPPSRFAETDGMAAQEGGWLLQ